MNQSKIQENPIPILTGLFSLVLLSCGHLGLENTIEIQNVCIECIGVDHIGTMMREDI